MTKSATARNTKDGSLPHAGPGDWKRRNESIINPPDWYESRLAWRMMLRERTTTARGGEAQGSTVRQGSGSPSCGSECDTNEQIRGKVTDQCSRVYETPLPLHLRSDLLYILIGRLRTSSFFRIFSTRFSSRLSMFFGFRHFTSIVLPVLGILRVYLLSFM